MKPQRPAENFTREQWREHRRLRFRRRSRRTYIRSVYFLPSLCTLGNAVCGFGAMYVSTLSGYTGNDDLTRWMAEPHRFTVAAYLIFLAMIFDALDGRLARWTRHTTDFGGQLDSLADVVSFGAAPAFMALMLFRSTIEDVHVLLSRLIWAIAALYFCCAALRLARFNVSNEHGEQHHFSFLGLPSPGAGGTVAAMVLMQQELVQESANRSGGLADFLHTLAIICAWAIPLIVLMTGLLMVSTIRYPHLVNRYMRGKRSMGRLIAILAILLVVIVAHKYVLAIGTLIYACWGLASVAYLRLKPRALLIAGRSTSSPPAAAGLPEKPAST